jgi:hypothetical protein
MKEYFKRLWNALWASTDVDEKAEAALKEVKARIAEMKKEIAEDVVDAAKGKKRRGRKSTNRRKTNNNSKK